MHALNRFETNLLSILYAVLGQSSVGSVLPMVHQVRGYSGCLTRTTVNLVQAALAKGVTQWLATQGGWVDERYLRDGKGVPGAVWQRTHPSELGLTFSSASLQFLIWLTANDPLIDSADPWLAMPEVVTPGDQLLILLTLERLMGTGVSERWFVMRKFARLPLVALFYPEQVAQREHPIVPDFLAELPKLTTILECLQPRLTQRWLEVEIAKVFITEADTMTRLGTQQGTVLNGYMDAVEAHGRRDLARFLLIVLQRLASGDVYGSDVGLSDDGTADPTEASAQRIRVDTEQLARGWVKSLRLGEMRLAARTIVYQAASIFLANAARLRAWTDQCRQVGYFDEGYAAAQLWLADWARYDGENTTLRAAAMVRSLSV